MLQRLAQSDEPLSPPAWGDSPFKVSKLTAAYNNKPVVFDVSFTAPRNALAAIIGPNGAGKSTFLKAALGLTPKLAGETRVFGKPLTKSRREIAYVPQRASVDWDFPANVFDVAMMGLQAEIGWLRWPKSEHKARVMAALESVSMQDFARRQIGQLSGGQRQRVFIARALVQNADVYLLDEPFAGVDAATEAAIMDVFRDLKRRGKTVICVHHDLATVRDYFDYVMLMNVMNVSEGPTAKAFTPETLAKAYDGRLPAQESFAAAAQ
ncbi:MAG: ABC transporter ATP-binding protein [Chitinophagales bacterium]|nr:ABC transporter ATP-binding protein [Hyphomicrobiales bacterium]